MQVKSIAECSNGSILQYFWLELQRFTEIVSYRDTLSDDTRIVSWGHLTIR